MDVAQPVLGTHGYIAIPKHYVRRDTTTGFDIYLNVGDGYVLYHAAAAAYDAAAENRLMQSAPEHLYVREDSAREVRGYLKMHLEEALADDSPPHVKAGLLFTATSDAFERVAGNPDDPATIESASDMAVVTMGQIANDPQILGSFLAYGQSGWHAYSHAVSCCFLASALGVRIGLGPDELAALSIAGLLHDIGFARLAPELEFRAPESLTQLEWTMRCRHPLLSAEIMARGGLPAGAVTMVRQHHERLNGRGFPASLSEQEIGLGARIVAIVDTYDRLVNPPPGQAPIGAFSALARMRHRMQGFFDTGLLMEFVQLLGSAEVAPQPGHNGWAAERPLPMPGAA